MNFKNFFERAKRVDPSSKWAAYYIEEAGDKEVFIERNGDVAFSIDDNEHLELYSFGQPNNLTTNLILDFISEGNRHNVFNFDDSGINFIEGVIKFSTKADFFIDQLKRNK